jgi:hypothetical protein
MPIYIDPLQPTTPIIPSINTAFIGLLRQPPALIHNPPNPRRQTLYLTRDDHLQVHALYNTGHSITDIKQCLGFTLKQKRELERRVMEA